MTNQKKSIDPVREELYQSALLLIELGFWIIPLYSIDEHGNCTCPKGKNCSSAGKHPMQMGSYKNAVNDKASVDRIWGKANVRKNIGVVATYETGLIIIDVDPRNGGDETLAMLEKKYGKFEAKVIVDTGGGGIHFYYILPNGFKVVGGAHKLGQGIDIIANGQYAVGPGSLHKSGGRYVIR